MWVYHHLDYYQQTELLRRCAAEALADPWDREFVWSKEREAPLIQGFRALRGITEIAHGLNCPEPEIMRKILELGLYERFGELGVVPGDAHAARIAQLRSETALSGKTPVVWSDVQENALFWLFCAGEDISKTVLTLNAPKGGDAAADPGSGVPHPGRVLPFRILQRLEPQDVQGGVMAAVIIPSRNKEWH